MATTHEFNSDSNQAERRRVEREKGKDEPPGQVQTLSKE
jgi:hypothetical protein